ncbi:MULTISPECIES: sulfite reductase subunit alpha [Dyella]|uniref:NADPH--hemoprotein reductase n=2 Tax=Dyella TaxID=231454 RepID=A0A4R0Z284_9GAMM|nr:MULTISPECIES: sulfite reductase subunit alpha [Dyella]TBR40028.1 sulfite reductase flavoprotein subunit alpha [Dyella terrae]TCI12390.1 sulfite reductase flavoprotein subunit alpha [Dyella soli]
MRDRALWGNVGLGAVLVGIAAWLWMLHVGGTPWTWPDASRIGMAVGVIALWLGLTWALARARRPRVAVDVPSHTGTGTLLIACASQTGFADQLAQQTELSLVQAGMRVQRAELGSLTDADLRNAGRVLFVVSTTGEGDAPDSAARFSDQTMRAPRDLHGVTYGVLALGDRDYEDFCGFGRRLHHWLVQSGAQPLFDPVEVNNGDDGALRHWQHHLSVLSGAVDLPDWQRPAYQTWTLRERQHLNPDSLGEACYHLVLEPREAITWQAGDIAEVEPRHSATSVQAWLDRAGVDGALMADGESLRSRMSRSYLPTLPLTSGDTATLLASLKNLPHREYSIASLPADGAVHLLVRQMWRDDGQLGLGSGWLTSGAQPGDEVALRIRANPQFHAPAGDVPMILIGNGTGLAGLRALLRQRESTGHHRNWLVFGERQAARDFFHREDIERWQREGHLQRLDLAWSRDPGNGRYVQQCLRDAADEVRHWVDQGAALFVCGSLAGMAPGVDAALRDILGESAVEQLRIDGRYRRDVY